MPTVELSPNPTQFAELNRVLGDLTRRAHAVLGDNFVGAYDGVLLSPLPALEVDVDG